MSHTNFETQTDHLISARQADQMIVNKRKSACRIVDFTVPADCRVKLKESEKIDTYLNIASELKKTMEHENDNDTNCNWCVRYNHQRIDKGYEEFGNKWMSGYYPNYSSIKISHNTVKSPRGLRRLAVTQTPVRNDQLTLVWKTLKNHKFVNTMEYLKIM